MVIFLSFYLLFGKRFGKNQNLEVSMKETKTNAKRYSFLVIAIIAHAFIACPTTDDSAKVQPDTIKSLSFGTDCKVTIKGCFYRYG
jgi:hypothetical protein